MKTLSWRELINPKDKPVWMLLVTIVHWEKKKKYENVWNDRTKWLLVTCIDIGFSNWWRGSDGTRLTLITTLPLHMELALNTWKSQLSRAGTGNSDVLNPWHWAVKSAIHNQLSRVMYSKTKGPFRTIVKISPHVVGGKRAQTIRSRLQRREHRS